MTSTALDPGIAARANRAIEPLHSLSYFAAEVDEALTAAGLRPGRMCYFASRSAPMGQVGAATTAATFFNFNPELVARHIPRAWTLASPQAVIEARFAGTERALGRLLGPEVLASAEVSELLDLARSASQDLEPAGRTLFAAHAALDWPTDTPVALWHALTLLREYRGDGHLAALLAAGLSGIQSIITHTATGRGFTVDAAKKLRGWSDEQWDAASAGLAEIGVLGPAGLTEAGITLRESVEDATDRMAAAPWVRLGPERTARLIELGKGLSRIAVGNGAFPAGVFAATR
jgi:helix-turn-helix protein